MDALETANAEAIEAWNGVLFDRFVQFRPIVTTGLGAHGEVGMRLYPPAPGMRVLDIGCGFGDTSQQLAAIVGADGSVLGVDAAERFIEVGREEAAAAGLDNVAFAVADVEAAPVEGTFDYAFSRFGTMFFANPVAALRNVRAALVPGARLVMVVWRQKADNGWVHTAEVITERFLTHIDQTDEPTCGPGPFSMANADTVSGIMLAAGFEDVSLHRSDLPFRAGADVEEAIAIITSLGPAGELIRINGAEGERQRPAIEAALREGLAAYTGPDGVLAPASTWVVSATVPVDH